MTYITNGSRRLMRDWVPHRIADEYAMSADWDNRWRPGGTVDEVMEEAHLSQDWLLRGIQRFVDEREQRLETARRCAGGGAGLNPQLGIGLRVIVTVTTSAAPPPAALHA